MKTLVLGCRPTLPNVEDEVNAVVAAAPGAELLLDPSAEEAASRAPEYDACHFAGHADPKLGQDRVLVWCHADGFAAVDASTLVSMLCKMELVVLNGCKSVEFGLKLRDAGVPCVVVWTTLLYDPAAKLFAVRFWEVLEKRNPDDELRVAVRKAFEAGKVAVQTAVKPSLTQGALDVGGGKTKAAAVPMYELHDPEDAAAQNAGRIAAGVPLLLQAATMHDVPNLPEQYERRTELESEHRNALLRSPRMMAITATTTGVSGPAGVGKSTMATVLAKDALVHAHFPDGVTWLSFGRERTGAEVLQKFAAQLRVELAPGEELRGGINRALVGQRRLLVLDDIWTEEQRDTFGSLTAENGLLGRLVTTRSGELAGEHARRVVVLQDVEGLRVLASYMDVKELTDDSAARRLVELCCGNPAMLRSVAALCKKRGTASTLDYLEKCREKLRLAKLPRAEDYEYRTLFDALAGSLDFLRGEDEQLAEKCRMLAAFPEDTQVPWFAVGQLWGVDELETENAVTELESWHLIDVDWTERTISLIDLHLDYLRASAKADLAQWQAGLLQRCGRRKLGVNEGREDDSYWGEDGKRHVLHHLTGCEPTAFSTEIVEVQLSGLHIRAERAMELARMLPQSKIARLDLWDNKIGDQGASALAAVLKETKICNLKLAFNQLGPEGGVALAEGLKGNSTLQWLSLQENELGPEGGAALAEGLKGNSTLQSLDLNRNYIGAEGTSALAAVLKETKISVLNVDGHALQIEELKGTKPTEKIDLSSQGLGDASAIIIASCIKENGVLKELNLADNALCGIKYGEGTYTAEGITKLCEGLKGSAVTFLNLRNNQIGDQGASALAAVLKETKISELNLYYNQIGDQGAIALAEGLKGNSTLQSLNIGNNKIGVEGVTKLAAVLNETKISELTLTVNSIGAEGATKLAAVLKETKISELNLRNNQIGDQGASALAAVLKETKISELNLANNQICGLDEYGLGTYTAEGITKLCEGLKGSAVTSLNLSENALCGIYLKHGNWGAQLGTYTAEGITKLSEGLKGSGVTSLKLQYNNLNDDAKKALRDAAGSDIKIEF